MLFAAGVVSGFSPTQQQSPPRDTSARPPAEPSGPSGRITGRVLDGVTGRPMKLARVTLNAPGTTNRAAQTDEAGVFDFLALPAGRYTLTVQKSGYVNLSYGQRRPLQPGTPIQLEDGQHFKDIEFRMPRGSVISGVIADEVGDPMPGITVRAMRFQYTQGIRQLVPAGAGQTDDRGMYRIWGMNPGEYYVTAVAPNFGRRGGLPGSGGGGRGGLAGIGRGSPPDQPDDVEVGYAPTYFPGVPSVFEATAVNVGLGAEINDINFNVLLVHTSRISGRVNNLDGTPVTAGEVTLAVEGTVGRGRRGLNLGGRIRWDGAFAIANVPPGRYALRARGTDDVAPQYAAVPITVIGGDLSDVVIVVAPGATVSGTVTFLATQAGAPPDPAQVRVVAQPADPNVSGDSASARVEKDGRFTLTGVPLGPYLLRANAPRGWVLRSVIVDGQDVIDTPLDVRSNQKIAGASLVFSDRQTDLSGTVADTQGRPVTEYTVLAFPTDATLWRPQARHIMTSRPDQNGRFQLRGLPPGDYYVAAVDPQQPGEWYDPRFLEEARADAIRVTLSDGGTRTHNIRINR
jgi:protocatechuate 3,4-dioxygenase beta subunit